MPQYDYIARDRDGNAAAGKLEAADERDLRKALRSSDLFLIKAKGHGEEAAKTARGRQGLFEGKPNLRDQVIVLRQLSTLFRAGLVMSEAMEIVAGQTNNRLLRAALEDMRSQVIEGVSLSNAMRRYPTVFIPLVVSLAEAGETAGTLDYTLELAASQLDREAVLRQKVKAATLYPKIVVAACVGTVALMLILVVPTFASVYTSLHATLPWATLTLIAISDFVLHSWWLALLICLGLWWAYREYAKTANGRKNLDIIALKIPVLGEVLRKIAIARFVQTLGGALRGGVPVLISLGISAGTSGNTVIRDAVTTVAQRVRDGAQMGRELEKTGQFPLMVSRMVAAGESSGEIDKMLDEINRFYERDIEAATEALTRLVEPVMTVAVGSIVLLVLLALYMPIFSLGKAFQASEKH
ncbi:MAG: type II secretion system F family protein [Armatimonadetes bacterium]|nr:type II secretion system F family protein [Armatimonadota bacterium]